MGMRLLFTVYENYPDRLYHINKFGCLHFNKVAGIGYNNHNKLKNIQRAGQDGKITENLLHLG